MTVQRRNLLQIDKVFSTKRNGLFASGIRKDKKISVKFGIDKIELLLPDGTFLVSEVAQAILQNERFTFCLGKNFTDKDIPIGTELYLIEDQD